MWRYACAVCAVIIIMALVVIMGLVSRQQVVPYLVSVDGQGKTLGVNRLEAQSALPKEFVPSELAEYVQNWRTATADFDLQKRMVEKLAFFTAGAAKGQLREWYEQNSPYEKARNGKLVQITIKGLPLPVSKDSWRVEWQELTRSHNGTLLMTETYAATLSVVFVPPQNESQILNNPGGILITEISVTKVLN